MLQFLKVSPDAIVPQAQNNSAIRSPEDVLMLILILLILVVFMVVMAVLGNAVPRLLESARNAVHPDKVKELTPTQHFILAASSPTLGNHCKCVIDVWGTHSSEDGRRRAKELFEWGWGSCTRENALEAAEHCLNEGHDRKYRSYLQLEQEDMSATLFTAFEINLMEEIKEKYPEKGILAWDIVRALSVVGGAYMAGALEYDEAAKVACEACRKLQQNFSSWDDVAENYTLGYQLWRGKRSKDRLKYYKRLKKTWIYDIDWNTVLKDEEL